MAANGTGSKGQPTFLETGAPEIGTDDTLVSNYAALVGNYKVGTGAQRAAATGNAVWEGLGWQDTDGTKGRYVYSSGVWVATSQQTTVTGGALAGAAWDSKSPLVIKTGSAVLSSTSGGVATLTWGGGAFPNGVLSVNLTNGDNSAFGGPINVFGASLTQLQVVPKLWTGGNATSVSFRVNYIAYGW